MGKLNSDYGYQKKYIYNYLRTRKGYIKTKMSSTKGRAKKAGIEYTITEADIEWPTHCPILGIELAYEYTGTATKRRFNAASIDRRDPTKGYVPGNVWVVSDLANRMKQDADDETLVAFAIWIINNIVSNK